MEDTPIFKEMLRGLPRHSYVRQMYGLGNREVLLQENVLEGVVVYHRDHRDTTTPYPTPAIMPKKRRPQTPPNDAALTRLRRMIKARES